MNIRIQYRTHQTQLVQLKSANKFKMKYFTLKCVNVDSSIYSFSMDSRWKIPMCAFIETRYRIWFEKCFSLILPIKCEIMTSSPRPVQSNVPIHTSIYPMNSTFNRFQFNFLCASCEGIGWRQSILVFFFDAARICFVNDFCLFRIRNS